MNTKELVAAVAAATGLPAGRAEEAVKAVLDTITSQVAIADKVALAGFGTFEVRERAARTGRNPQTGEPIDIPAGRTIGFKPAAKLRAALTA